MLSKLHARLNTSAPKFTQYYVPNYVGSKIPNGSFASRSATLNTKNLSCYNLPLKYLLGEHSRKLNRDSCGIKMLRSKILRCSNIRKTLTWRLPAVIFIIEKSCYINVVYDWFCLLLNEFRSFIIPTSTEYHCKVCVVEVHTSIT